MLKSEESLKKFATSDVEKCYIYDLGNESLDNVKMVNDCGEIESFQDILDIALASCIHYWDFETEDIMKREFPDVEYTLLQYKASGSDWSIEQTENGKIIARIGILPEQHMTMKLLGTLDDMIEYILIQSVADNVIVYNVESGKEY